jgi:hypothetical protein
MKSKLCFIWKPEVPTKAEWSQLLVNGLTGKVGIRTVITVAEGLRSKK